MQESDGGGLNITEKFRRRRSGRVGGSGEDEISRWERKVSLLVHGGISTAFTTRQFLSSTVETNVIAKSMKPIEVEEARTGCSIGKDSQMHCGYLFLN